MKLLSKERILTISMLIGTAAVIIMGSFTAFAKECEELPKRLFRLHILANSDSEEDQALKYALRDYLSNDMTYIFQNCTTAEEAKAAAKSNLNEIVLKSRQFIQDQGYDYSLSASVEQAYFTTRRYGNTVIPAGEYDCLRIIIGSGEGKNWWCIMFPPLCLNAVEEYVLNENDLFICQSGIKSGFRNTLSPYASKKTEESPDTEIKFALYEWILSLINRSDQALPK